MMSGPLWQNNAASSKLKVPVLLKGHGGLGLEEVQLQILGPPMEISETQKLHDKVETID